MRDRAEEVGDLLGKAHCVRTVNSEDIAQCLGADLAGRQAVFNLPDLIPSTN